MSRKNRTLEEVKEEAFRHVVRSNAAKIHRDLTNLLQLVINVEPIMLDLTCDEVNIMISEDILDHDIRTDGYCEDGDRCPYENGRYAYFMREMIRVIQGQNIVELPEENSQEKDSE